MIKDEVDNVAKDVLHDGVKQVVDNKVKNVVEDSVKDVGDVVEQDVDDMVKNVLEESVKVSRKLVMYSMWRKRTSTSGNIGPALRARRKWVYNVPRRTGHSFAV